jgi:protein Tob/BTG
MLPEVDAASTFLAGLGPRQLPPAARDAFQRAVRELMLLKFYQHWNVDAPLLGNGYRAIVNSGQRPDPLLVQAAGMVGVPDLAAALPSELVVWVDPHEVAYRIGEQGSVCTLYDDGYRRARRSFGAALGGRPTYYHGVPVN